MGVLVNESENRRFLSAGFSPPSVYKLTPSISKGLGRVVKNTSLQQQQVLKSLVSYQTAALDHPEWSGALL